MIALLTTYFIISYVLVPGVMFRVFAGFFVRLRLFQMTKTQEITLGVLVAIAPLVFSNLFVWNVSIAKEYPFPYTYGSVDEYKRDYRLAMALVVAEDPEKLLEPVNDPKNPYQQAVSTIWRRQFRFLCWYFLFSGAEGAVFGYFGRKYGDWSGITPLYDWLARKILLPNISEWQLLLTDFTFPKKPKREVRADVLCDGTLYRGRVGDYFLDTTGNLSGLFMKDVERFRLKEFKAACKIANGEKINREEFWREIPGSNFYIPADKISNLNVRFLLLDNDLRAFMNALIQRLNLPPGTTVSVEDPKSSVEIQSNDATTGDHDQVTAASVNDSKPTT